jgi:ABC-2 type transport system permease protein
MRKVFAVATKELRQIVRDRRTLLILLFVPAFFLLLYGYALNFDIRNVALVVKDQDRLSSTRGTSAWSTSSTPTGRSNAS